MSQGDHSIRILYSSLISPCACTVHVRPALFRAAETISIREATPDSRCFRTIWFGLHIRLLKIRHPMHGCIIHAIGTPDVCVIHNIYACS